MSVARQVSSNAMIIHELERKWFWPKGGNFLALVWR
jgi:hypothetical protein